MQSHIFIHRCAECLDDCDKGEDLQIRECDKNDKKQHWIFHRCTVRPRRNRKFCITAGETRSDSDKGRIKIYRCDPKNKIQYFTTFDPDSVSKKFQFKFFKPGKEDVCLTQEHHPRDKERLRFADCEKAEKNDKGVYDDTSHWVVGTFDGHP